MFWSGNYIAVRELNSLLKEENVTLTQVLEADDVLQECKADNKALILFLTRPDVLAELVTLITEEPPKDVELGLQYLHATIACEVLTSQLPTLSDRLSMDTALMHRLCDFINREPPLNPLLASYFSKTIEMLLERSPKQDWYLYHIVCLRVLDFLKARRDFLPNLLRHLHTSAALDALKCFIRLNDLFNKLVMEWLEEHQFLESLIAIICGTYEPPPLEPRPAPAPTPAPASANELEKGQQEQSEKAEQEGVEKGDLDAQGKEVIVESPPAAEAQATGDAPQVAAGAEAEAEAEAETAADRLRAVASANAAALLTDIILNGCAPEYSQLTPTGSARSRSAMALVAQACSARGVDALLQGMFTCGARARGHALQHGARALRALRRAEQDQPAPARAGAGARGGVELAVAPHLPLLHTALLQAPEPYPHEPPLTETPGDGGGGAAPPAPVPPPAPPAPSPPPGSTAPSPPPPPGSPAPAAEPPPPPPPPPPRAPRPPRAAVGAARLEVAALLAELCSSEVDEVASTMITLGTPGVLIDMFFAHPDNNFLHAHVLSMVRNALDNRAYRTQYTRNILEECDLFNRLMDVYEENESKRGQASCPRAGYMGHVTQLLRALAPELAGPALERWGSSSVQTLLQRLETPLGGYYPSENTYEVESADGMVEVETRLYNVNYSDYPTEEDLNEVASNANMNKFLELSNQRLCDNPDMWDDAVEGGAGADNDEREADGEAEAEAELEAEDGPRHTVHDVLAPVSPWESSYEESNMAGEGWAQFSADTFGSPADPFAGDAFASTDAFANDAFAKSDAFSKSDAFANSDGFVNSDAFTKRERFDGTAFANDSFRDATTTEEFTPFWGYQDKDDDSEGASGVEAGLRGLRLDKPMDALSSSLADNLRTAMSSMTPEVIANIVNANMTPALDVPLGDVPNVTDASNVTNASSVTVTDTSNITNASSITVTDTSNITDVSSITVTDASNITNASSITDTGASNITNASSITGTDASNITNASSITVTDTSNITNACVTEASNVSVTSSDSNKPRETSVNSGDVSDSKCSVSDSEPSTSDPEPSPAES